VSALCGGLNDSTPRPQPGHSGAVEAGDDQPPRPRRAMRPRPPARRPGGVGPDRARAVCRVVTTRRGLTSGTASGGALCGAPGGAPGGAPSLATWAVVRTAHRRHRRRRDRDLERRRHRRRRGVARRRWPGAGHPGRVRCRCPGRERRGRSGRAAGAPPGWTGHARSGWTGSARSGARPGTRPGDPVIAVLARVRVTTTRAWRRRTGSRGWRDYSALPVCGGIRPLAGTQRGPVEASRTR
jgi:hypothetical protein